MYINFLSTIVNDLIIISDIYIERKNILVKNILINNLHIVFKKQNS